jgi:phosphate transport system permease protein
VGNELSEATLKTAATAPANLSLVRRWTLMEVKEQTIRLLLFLCALGSVLTTAGIILVLAGETILFLLNKSVSVWEFFTGTQWTPDFLDRHFGIWPLVSGTVLIAGIAGAVGLPIGLAAALYLSEYASPRSRAVIKPILEILAGIPSIVFGYFALVFITPYVLRPIFRDWLGFEVDVFNAASAGIAVGIMIIPTVSSLSEDVLRAVPQGLREAGFALGSTKFDVCVRIVLPAALSGILASFLLAISRAIGETMAVAIAAGSTPHLGLNMFSEVETMTAYIANRSKGDSPAGTIEYQSMYAVAMLLFSMTLTMNIAAQFVLRRFRNVYQ